MSKLNDFLAESIGIVIENKRSGKRAIDPTVPQEISEKLSFNQIVTALEKIDPSELNAGPKAEVFGLILVDKLKRENASEAQIKTAKNESDYYAINITDRKVRSNQLSEITKIAKEVDPEVGTFKAKLKDSFGLK